MAGVSLQAETECGLPAVKQTEVTSPAGRLYVGAGGGRVMVMVMVAVMGMI
jgi:hypothetical protein